MQLGRQALGIAGAGAYSAVVTLLVLQATKRLVGLRVRREEEREGLDSTQHEESGYAM
jgi:Amt family ammonium transporter